MTGDSAKQSEPQTPSSNPIPMYHTRKPLWKHLGFSSKRAYEVYEQGQTKRREQAKRAQEKAARTKEKAEREHHQLREVKQPSRNLPLCPGFLNALQAWRVASLRFLEDKSGQVTFPRLPTQKTYGRECPSNRCTRASKLGVCHHDVDVIFRELEFPKEMPFKEFLKKERLGWHPDRFSTRPEFQEEAKEMFQLLQKLIDNN